MTPTAEPALDDQLADEIGEFYDDPEGFVDFAFPWGEKGTALEKYSGPDEWQRIELRKIGEAVRERNFNFLDPVAPIRVAIASGHGIGKSTLTAWVTNWIMSTRPNCKGTVTANTFPQLETKTWAQIQKWFKLSITGDWFEVTARSIYRKGEKEGWGCSAQTCREENSESFAGQHAADSTSFYIFDEASNIPDSIFEVAEGGLSDGEPMIFLFGNPTRSTGKFYRAVFGSDQHRWLHSSIDSRTCTMPNKAQIEEWIADYGEDSDFVRVRVRGLPPRASELQFIDQQRVWDAQHREPAPFADEPLVVGVDFSGGGAAWNVVRFRKGSDARSIPPIRVPGEHTRGDRGPFLARLAEVLRDQRPGFRVSMMFCDSAFGSPYVERLHALGFHNVVEVNFGGPSPDAHQENWRAYMWNRMKEWLPKGSIDPKDQTLELDLTGPGYHLNKSDRLVIEAKQSMAKRGVASPDDGDALALTFAQPVAVPQVAEAPTPEPPGGEYAWMG